MYIQNVEAGAKERESKATRIRVSLLVCLRLCILCFLRTREKVMKARCSKPRSLLEAYVVSILFSQYAGCTGNNPISASAGDLCQYYASSASMTLSTALG